MRAPAPNAIVQQPRPFGYVVGDVLTQRVLLQVEGRGFEPAALPAAGRVGAWLERRTPRIESSSRRASLAGRGLSGDQCAASADDRRACRPGSSDPSPARRRLRIGAWPISVSALTPRQAFAQGGLEELRPDRPAPIIATQAHRRQMAIWSSALVATLAAWAGWCLWRNWRSRSTQPFARALREIRRLEDSAPEAWLALHRAFDRTAGRAMQTATLADLFRQAPHLAPLRPRHRAVLRPVGRALLRRGTAGQSAVGAQAVHRAAPHREAARAMSGGLDLAQPWALLLLPLALLPLLRSRRDTLPFSSLAWLPADRMGRIAGFVWRALGVLAILSTVLALAGPGRRADAGHAHRTRRRDPPAHRSQPQHGRPDADERLANARSARGAGSGLVSRRTEGRGRARAAVEVRRGAARRPVRVDVLQRQSHSGGSLHPARRGRSGGDHRSRRRTRTVGHGRGLGADLGDQGVRPASVFGQPDHPAGLRRRGPAGRGHAPSDPRRPVAKPDRAELDLPEIGQRAGSRTRPTGKAKAWRRSRCTASFRA